MKIIEKLLDKIKIITERNLTLKRLYRGFLIRFLKRTFNLWEIFGFHIIPIYCYSPIPDTKNLKNSLWTNISECTGIDFNEKKQLELLEICLQNFNKEYNNFPMEQTSIPYEYYRRNGTFSTVDAEILYSFIRYFKPKKIIEIGSGKSTFLSAQAIIKNKNLDSTYTCNFLTIDLNMPKVIENGFPGLTRVINKEVQDVSMSEFTDLKENDILFIDSSHILKTGSDVQYEYLEILPKLNKGVIIHAHDIFIPSEYPKDFIYKRHEFWTEQYLVQAFLMFNKDFEILWAGNYMNLKYPEKLESAFKTYIKHHSWPVSLWMRKIK